MNWLFIIIGIVLIISAFAGYKRGFIKTAFALVSVVVALLATAVLSPTVSKILRNNEKVHTAITEQLDKVVEFDKDIKKTSQEANYIEKLALPEVIKKSLIENNNIDVYKQMAVDSFQDYVVNALAVIIINVISYIVCFVIVWILLFVLSRALDLISKLPLLNEVNKTAGLFMGLLSGCIRVWLFFLVITLFSTSEFGKSIFDMINDSKLLTFIYDNNLLIKGLVNITQSIF